MKFDKQRPTVSVQVQNTFMFHVPSHTGAAERANHPSRIRQRKFVGSQYTDWRMGPRHVDDGYR